MQSAALEGAEAGQPRSLKTFNAANSTGSRGDTLTPPVNLKPWIYPIPDAVVEQYPEAIVRDTVTDLPVGIKEGRHFLSNGDIMIPTEDLSVDAFRWIRGEPPYVNPLNLVATLDTLQGRWLRDRQDHGLGASNEYVVTKHMYWPVRSDGFTAIPVFRGENTDSTPTSPMYQGYETWTSFVAVDPSGLSAGNTVNISYLYGVLNPDSVPAGPFTQAARVFAIEDFYHHRITKDDWKSMDEGDKAALNAASYWAYNAPIGPGDYLVTIAMHINTKEIETWALQSVWWSDRPDSGPEAEDRPTISEALGPWDHYLLTDSYGIESSPGRLPIATNPYIEPVIHPFATNCQNCHLRAGWPKDSLHASYQNENCRDLLVNLRADSTCLNNIFLTDLQWIIPDRAIR